MSDEQVKKCDIYGTVALGKNRARPVQIDIRYDDYGDGVQEVLYTGTMDLCPKAVKRLLNGLRRVTQPPNTPAT